MQRSHARLGLDFQSSAHLSPHLGSGHTIVTKAHARATENVLIAALAHDLSQTRPQHHQHTALAVVLVDAGATKFDQSVTDRTQPGKVKLRFRVIAAGTARLRRCQNPICTDDTIRSCFPHHEVITPRVKRVAIQTIARAIEHRSVFGAEHRIAQALDRLQLFACLCQPDDQGVLVCRGGR